MRGTGSGDALDVALWQGVDQYGNTDSSAGIQAGVNYALSFAQPPPLYMRAGTYLADQAITAELTSAPLFIAGDGEGLTILKTTGANDWLRMYNPNPPPGGWTGLAEFGGGISGVTFDGSAAAAGARGLHIGDGEHFQVEAEFRHFNQAGSAGLHIDNSGWWTEKGRWRCVFEDCTTAVLGTQSSGNNSFAENDFDFIFFLSAGQSAISLQGVSLYLGRLKARGVFNAGVTNTGVFLSGDASSAINNCLIDVALNAGQAGVFHQTCDFATGFSFQSNFGRFLFNGGPWTAGTYPGGTWAGNQTSMSLAGDILGDTNINPAATATGGGPPQPALLNAGNPVIYAPGFIRASDGKINDFMGDFFGPLVLTGSITVGLGGGTFGSVPGPQRKTIILKQAAAGGPYTVTWPHSAAPTVTTPKVVWAGGAAPVMSTGASAVDVYKLETTDGATWYGQAVQNVS